MNALARWNQLKEIEALRQSLEFFEGALDKDPRFARAWTGIAKSWLWLSDVYVPPLEGYSKVREAALSALRIDDEEAEAEADPLVR